MNDFFLTKGNMQDLIALLQEELEITPALKVTAGTAHTGKWSMSRLWYMWMEPTAKMMAANGVKMPLMISADGEHYGERPFSKQDAHDLFTHKWLGCDENGTRLSWSKNGHDEMRAATSGERFHALRQHEAWCTEKGIILFKPREGEYHELQQQEAA